MPLDGDDYEGNVTMRSFADSDTEFAIVSSETPVSVDGYAIGEPKFLQCGAQVYIDGPEGHTTTIDNLPHESDCSQRGVASRYFEEQFVR